MLDERIIRNIAALLNNATHTIKGIEIKMYNECIEALENELKEIKEPKKEKNKATD